MPAHRSLSSDLPSGHLANLGCISDENISNPNIARRQHAAAPLEEVEDIPRKQAAPLAPNVSR